MGVQLCSLPRVQRLSMRCCCVKGTTLSPAVLAVKVFAQACIPQDLLPNTKATERVGFIFPTVDTFKPDYAAGRGGDE